MLKTILDDKPDLQKYLFDKGFLITNAENLSAAGYPFYNNWEKTTVGAFTFWVNKSARLFVREWNKKYIFLIGHAFNPFSMEADEDVILDKLVRAHGTPEYFRILNELTGVFILGVVEDGKIEALLDASGQQYGCYGCVGGKLYIASHMRLVGDICGLETSAFVQKLVSYKWYRYMMGYYLPGDITCYSEFKRIIPNTYVRFDGKQYTITRFFPNREIKMCETEDEYREVIEQAAAIMNNTMALIPKKWKRPAISLTGGIDSNTTFAAANGHYDRYTTFSYVSLYRESVDADMAKQISDRFGVRHARYEIPEDNRAIPDFETFKLIFDYNHGGIGVSKDSDARKKITLIRSDVCDVEVKSWISETIRAYAYQYFGRKRFPRSLSARNYTALYKIFLLNRRLVWETDRCFAEYLSRTRLKSHLFNYDESDFFVWEHMHGGKCGLDIGVMKSCFDITIPYNNRNLLDLLLRVPLDDRRSDRHHMDLKRLMNSALYDMNIRVINLNQTEARKWVANLIYTINSFLPF